LPKIKQNCNIPVLELKHIEEKDYKGTIGKKNKRELLIEPSLPTVPKLIFY
jgi:hypothetical protein